MQPREIAESLSDALAGEITVRREAMGLSKNETATRAGLAVSFVSDLESKKRRPSIETLVKLAWVFETTASEILAKIEKDVKFSEAREKHRKTSGL